MRLDITTHHSSGYSLSLSDGNSWWVTSDADSHQWVAELATIMELEECAPNGSPKLIFSRMLDKADLNDTLGRPYSPPRLSKEQKAAGWMLYDTRAIRIWSNNNIRGIICEFRNSDNDGIRYTDMWDSLLVIYRQSMISGGLPFHAAFAELEGKGVLFAAQGNTGKSTCYRRFPDYWKPLCDDEALVVLGGQQEYRAHPFPTWNDYRQKRANNTWNVQYSVPLSGMFFLEQSKTDTVVPLGEGEAAILISESAIQICRKSWRVASTEDMQRYRREIFDNACKLAKRVPAFRLHISLHGRFWEKIEEILT